MKIDIEEAEYPEYTSFYGIKDFRDPIDDIDTWYEEKMGVWMNMQKSFLIENIQFMDIEMDEPVNQNESPCHLRRKIKFPRNDTIQLIEAISNGNIVMDENFIEWEPKNTDLFDWSGNIFNKLITSNSLWHKKFGIS
jgi:hypothetical protein